VSDVGSLNIAYSSKRLDIIFIQQQHALDCLLVVEDGCYHHINIMVDSSGDLYQDLSDPFFSRTLWGIPTFFGQMFTLLCKDVSG